VRTVSTEVVHVIMDGFAYSVICSKRGIVQNEVGDSYDHKMECGVSGDDLLMSHKEWTMVQ